MRRDHPQCSHTPPAQLRSPASEQAPRVARGFLAQTTCTVHHPRMVDDAELLVSELVTNAVRHGTPPITVRVECEAERGLCVSVTDENPEEPTPRVADAEDENGRGMRLVDVISDRWGVQQRDGDGKEIWFRLRD